MKLARLSLKGFKAIGNTNGADIDFGDITLLLGANGSGKSSIVSFFKMLGYMMSGGLEYYVQQQSVWNLLFYGPKTTDRIDFSLAFKDGRAEDRYSASLAFGLPQRLFISSEQLYYSANPNKPPLRYHVHGDGIKPGIISDTNETSKIVSNFLRTINAYQFHDTTDTARIKGTTYFDDCKYLRFDAGNLAAFLLRLKRTEQYLPYYERIVNHIRKIVPQFVDFDLESTSENANSTRLNWHDSSGRDYIFGPHQLSDGSLRFMALATLLLQPPELLPRFIVIDEPELGLHPAAIVELAAMTRMASKSSQVLLATQSSLLVNQFGLENLVIAERNREKNCSEFKRPDPEKLKDWLNDYSLAELWEKNVIGGRP